MRPRSYLLPLLLGALLAASLLATPAARAADGVITGQIVGQNGASNVGGATVTLTIGTAAGGTPQQRTAQVGADGSFRFDGFAYDASAVYLVRVTYDGGNYFREVDFPTGSASATLDAIQVYPGGRDASALTVPRMNTIFSTFDQNGIAQAIETGAYNNASDHAFVGTDSAAGGRTLQFGLPQGATGVEPAQGLNRNTLVALSDPNASGFASIEAILPGEQQFAFIYKVQTHADTLDMDRIFPYPLGLYSLYLPTSARLASGGQEIGLRDSGEQTLQNGQKFRVFTANNIPAGGHLTARFTGLPTGGTQVNPLIPAMLVFTLLVGIGLIIAYGRKRGPSVATSAARRQIKTVPGNPARAGVATATPDDAPVSTSSPAPVRVATPRPPTEDPIARKERLLLELVELDERHEAGELSAEEYRVQRQRRKDELVATLRVLETTGAGARRP
jgi:hypothetical protein